MCACVLRGRAHTRLYTFKIRFFRFHQHVTQRSYSKHVEPDRKKEAFFRFHFRFQRFHFRFRCMGGAPDDHGALASPGC